MTGIKFNQAVARHPVLQSRHFPGLEAVADLARAKGLNTTLVLNRLAHSSFVSGRYRYLYVETPKAACTALKRFIVALEGVKCDFERKPYLRETRMNMLIHQRLFVAIPTLIDLKPADAQALLSGKTDFAIFGLVRNPFSRLVSTYESKIRLSEPGFRAQAAKWSALETGADIRATFADFLKANLDYYGSERGEHHFIPQYQLLMPDLLPYTRLFPVERFQAFAEWFTAYLRGKGAQGPLTFSDENRTIYPDWRYYYDADTAKLVADFYRKDFEVFGYDPESWRIDGPLPPLITTQEESAWRKAVIERNEMIEFLHKHFAPQTDAAKPASSQASRPGPG